MAVYRELQGHNSRQNVHCFSWWLYTESCRVTTQGRVCIVSVDGCIQRAAGSQLKAECALFQLMAVYRELQGHNSRQSVHCFSWWLYTESCWVITQGRVCIVSVNGCIQRAAGSQLKAECALFQLMAVYRELQGHNSRQNVHCFSWWLYTESCRVTTQGRVCIVSVDGCIQRAAGSQLKAECALFQLMAVYRELLGHNSRQSVHCFSCWLYTESCRVTTQGRVCIVSVVGCIQRAAMSQLKAECALFQLMAVYRELQGHNSRQSVHCFSQWLYTERCWVTTKGRVCIVLVDGCIQRAAGSQLKAECALF